MAKSTITLNNNEVGEKYDKASFQLLHSNYQRGNGILRAKYRETLFKEVIRNSAEDKLVLAKVFMDIAKSHIKLAEAAIPELKLQYYNDAAVTWS